MPKSPACLERHPDLIEVFRATPKHRLFDVVVQDAEEAGCATDDEIETWILDRLSECAGGGE